MDLRSTETGFFATRLWGRKLHAYSFKVIQSRRGRKLHAYSFKVIQNFNSYRRFVRIETILGDNKASVIILESSYNEGWDEIAGKIQRFLGPHVDSRFHLADDQAKSLMEAARIRKWPNIDNTEAGQASNENFLLRCSVGEFNDSFNTSPNQRLYKSDLWPCGKSQQGSKSHPLITINFYLSSQGKQG